MNINKLKKMLGDDDKMVARFLAIFKEETPKQLSKLSKAINQKDWESVSIHAHSIKSQVRYLDLGSIAQKAFEIEMIAEKKEGFDKVPQLYKTLNADLQILLHTSKIF